MSFFEVNTTEDFIKENSGSFINQSGMYDVTIENLIVRTKDNSPAKWIDMIIGYRGSKQTIYRAIQMVNNNGQPNFNSTLFNKICIIAGLGHGSKVRDPISRDVCVNSKTGKVEKCQILDQFVNLPLTVRLQKRYTMYNGKIWSDLQLKNVFRTSDKATASEIVNNSDHKGKQYEKELAIAVEIDYRDGITPEMVKQADEEYRKGTETISKPSENLFASMKNDDVPF